MSFNAIRENKIIAKISESTVIYETRHNKQVYAYLFRKVWFSSKQYERYNIHFYLKSGTLCKIDFIVLHFPFELLSKLLRTQV